jgi:small-conductance mechanosensitive channel
MSSLSNFLNFFTSWISSNINRIIFSLMGIIIIVIIYRILSRQINQWKEHKKLEENIAFTLRRILQWITVLILVMIGFSLFGIDIGIIGGMLALAGGTIIGFASMNTLGNAIAGIIVMTSRPFKIGDRLFFNGKFADVVAIDLIYTRMRTLDNVLVSIPNQELLKTEIENFGKNSTVRRKCSITVGYDFPFEKIESTLIESAKNVTGVLSEPKPYVLITDFQNFSVEYTLYVYINQIKKLRVIDSNLKRTILESCTKNGIDLTTPSLIQSVSTNTDVSNSE